MFGGIRAQLGKPEYTIREAHRVWGRDNGRGSPGQSLCFANEARCAARAGSARCSNIGRKAWARDAIDARSANEQPSTPCLAAVILVVSCSVARACWYACSAGISATSTTHGV